MLLGHSPTVQNANHLRGVSFRQLYLACADILVYSLIRLHIIWSPKNASTVTEHGPTAVAVISAYFDRKRYLNVIKVRGGTVECEDLPRT